MTTLFVSDLHLDPSRPAATRCFLEFLEQAPGEARSLYILGDLFESWIGDDDPCPHARRVVDALHRATASGLSCHFTQGNRDFLVGRRFFDATGVLPLDEATVVELHGRRMLLMHGDQLCTDDLKYQRFRAAVRRPRRQAIFLATPLAFRRFVWNRVRSRSQQSLAGKPEYITDVNSRAVAEAMRSHQTSLLIHGHTHRPAVHTFDLDWQPATRIVLSDWYEQGSVLEFSDRGFDLKTIDYR